MGVVVRGKMEGGSGEVESKSWGNVTVIGR